MLITTPLRVIECDAGFVKGLMIPLIGSKLISPLQLKVFLVTLDILRWLGDLILTFLVTAISCNLLLGGTYEAQRDHYAKTSQTNIKIPCSIVALEDSTPTFVHICIDATYHTKTDRDAVIDSSADDRCGDALVLTGQVVTQADVARGKRPVLKICQRMGSFTLVASTSTVSHSILNPRKEDSCCESGQRNEYYKARTDYAQ